MTEPEIDALCQRADAAAADAVGRICCEAPDTLNHIICLSAALKLMHIAAKTIGPAFAEKQVEDGAPEICHLIRGWGDALQVYPNMQLLNERLTKHRDRFIEKLRG